MTLIAKKNRKISFDQLDLLSKKLGLEQLNYASFKKAYDEYEPIASLVKSFNNQTLILKSETSRYDDSDFDNQEKQTNSSKDTVEKMAKNAVDLDDKLI